MKKASNSHEIDMVNGTILDKCGIKYRKYEQKNKKIEIDL